MNKNTNVSFWTYSDCNDIGTGSVGASFREKRSDHVFFYWRVEEGVLFPDACNGMRL